MATRFNPGGYKPELAGVSTAEKVRTAVAGLGDLMDDYEFHYPQELSPREPGDGAARRSRGTGSTASQRAASRSALRQGRVLLSRRRGPGGGASADARGDRPGGRGRGALHHLAGDRGLQLPVPDPVRVVVGSGSSTGSARPPSTRRAGRDGVPRAQELGAGDEDPHAQHRDDAARDPHAARPGDRQRAGEHGLAAPDHERREPRRVRRAARRRGAARPSARELGLGHLRRRQHGRRDRVHGDARARDRAAPRRLRRQRRAARLRPLPLHRRRRRRRQALGRCNGASSTRVAAKIDEPALREAQQAKDAVRAYELVYAALGA